MSYAYFCLWGILPLFFGLNDSLCSYVFVTEERVGRRQTMDMSSLDCCLFVQVPSCLHVSPSLSFRQAGALRMFLLGPTNCAWSLLMLIFFKGHLHLSETLHYISCPCVVFCTFQSLHIHHKVPVETGGAGIRIFLFLEMRKLRFRDFKWLSQGHTA